MNTLPRLTIVLTGLLSCALAGADQAVLGNGDRVSGTLLEQTMDAVVMETAWGGKITIRRADLVGLSTDRPLRIRLHDDRSFEGTLGSDDSGRPVIETTDRQRIRIDGLEAIAAMAPVASEQPPRYEWRGNVTLSGELKTGNTDTDKLNVGTHMVIEKKNINRVTLDAMLAREHADNRLTKEQYQLGGKYDHFFHERWFGFIGAAFEQDPFRDIDLRSVVSAGSGYQFFDSNELRLSLEAGLSYTDTRFIVDEDDRYAGFNWGLNWEQALPGNRATFFHRHRGNQGLDSSDNLIVKARTGIRVPIAAGLTASAEYDLDWDRPPAEDTSSMDHTYRLGVGYDW